MRLVWRGGGGRGGRVVRGVGIYEWWCAVIRGVLVRVGARVWGRGAGMGWGWRICGSGAVRLKRRFGEVGRCFNEDMPYCQTSIKYRLTRWQQVLQTEFSINRFLILYQPPPPTTSAPVATIPPPFLNPGSMIVLKLIIHPRPSLPKKRKKYMSYISHFVANVVCNLF